MKPVIIIAIAFVLLIPTSVFAEQGYWIDEWGKQISHPPTVCIFQPNDPRIDESRWNNWYSDAKTGIDTWRSILSQTGQGNWDINIVEVSLDKADLLNHSACDVSIKFVKQLYESDGNCVNALGCAWQGGLIKIVYSNFEYCGKVYNSDFGINVNRYCFSDNFTRSKQMANTVQHEFGHALGLGHYRGYDSTSTQEWYDYKLGAPSIMAWIEPNEEVRQISQNDVSRILDWYGSQGFGKKIDNTSVFKERIIPEKIIQVSDRGDIHLYEGKTASYPISGSIPDKLFKRGTQLEIIIQKPDGTTKYDATSVSKTLKKFNHNISFGYSDPAGKYKISLKFDGTIFDKKEIQISKSSITSKTPVETTKFLPDIDGDGVPDKDDKCPRVFGDKDRMGCKTPVETTKFLPDIDGDGVPDKDDKCPRVFTLTDDGCPENTNKLENTAIEKLTQNLISKNDLNWAIAKKEDTKSSLLDIESKFKQSYNSLQQAEKDFVGDVPKNHIQKGFDMRMKILKGFPDLQGMGKSIIRNIETLEYEQNEGNVHSVIFSDIKWNVENFEKDAKKMSSDMKYISQELDYAKQSFESSQPKTCFLMWCW